ncbi:MAG TPA: hypothetical protein VFX65_05310 [Candidatus Limnocylindrales bacterium]|nr:hypothetical protein [Candidatus Limnocylindrales bacterium]
MRRLTWMLPIALLVLWLPGPALADHCGADATISPPTGPPGTTFVFRTNLGAPSDLRVYRNGRLVRDVYLAGDGFVRYRIRTVAGDTGDWRARAEVRGSPECAAEVSFTVIGPPDTSIRFHDTLGSSRPLTLAIIWAPALAAFVAALALPAGRRRTDSARRANRHETARTPS